MMRAAVIEKPGVITVMDVAIPEPGPKEVLIRIAASGICGTDIHIFNGDYLGTYPIIPGHEFSGIVASAGSEVTRVKPGDRVAVEPNISCGICDACLGNRQNFCRDRKALGVDLPGGMAEFTAVPESAVFPIGDLSFRAGAFAEPLSCVIHGAEQIGLRLGDRILIIGAGPVGILLAQVMRLMGASEITQADRNEFRLDFAKQLNGSVACALLEDLPEDFFDAAADATGSPRVMERTVTLVREGGSILLFGVPPKEASLSLPAFTLFRKGITLKATYTSVRNSVQAVRLLGSKAVTVEPLVSHELPLEEIAHGFALVSGGLEQVMKVHVLPGSTRG